MSEDSEEIKVIKESDCILKTGLTKKKTLENFGFITNQPIESKLKVIRTNSLLFKYTKEDRDKIIFEKVALVFIGSDISSQKLTLINNCSNTKLESKYLNKIRNVENKLWKKSLLDEENESEFYVKNLIKYLKPDESNQFMILNNLSQFSPHEKI